MSGLRRAVCIAAAVGVSVVALAVPAHAGSINGSCSANGVNGDNTLAGVANYTQSGDGWRNYYQFAGRPFGQGNGNKNNVNIWFYQDYVQNWTAFSPDNVANGGWYRAGANINMPPWSAQD